MYCRNCGTKLENDNQVKCENCGFVEENLTSTIDNDNFFGKEEKVEESVQDVQGKCVCECKSDPVNVNAIIGFCCSFCYRAQRKSISEEHYNKCINQGKP